MARSKLGLSTMIALAIVAAACSPPDDVSVTTSAAATTTTTTTTTLPPTTTTTTTTTTLPLGLAPQVLEYGLAGGDLARYDTTQHLEIALGAGLLGGVSDEAGTIVFDLEGRTRNLVLESRDGTVFELSQDFRPDSGVLFLEVGSTSTTQTLETADLGDFSTVGAFAGFDASGGVADARAGAPGSARTGNPGVFLVANLGPVLSGESVDEGSEWSTTYTDELFGEIVTSTRIAAEVDTGPGYAFEMSFEFGAEDLPFEIDLTEAPDIAGLEDFLDSLLFFDDFTVELQALEGTGTGTFDPELGVFTRLETSTLIEFQMSFAIDQEAGGGAMSLEQDVTHELDDVVEANSFDVSALVGFHEPDPFLLAEQRLLVAENVDTFFFDDELSAAIDEKVAEVGGVVGGVATGERFEFDVDDFDASESIVVQVITNGGGLRGSPELAEELAGIWSPRRPTLVELDGGTAHRFALDGAEWLVGSDAQYTYVIVGTRSLAETAMSQYLSAPLPYRWQVGDCVDFRDWDGDLPVAPFGEYGLTHCADRHQYEVIYAESLAEPDEDVPYPDDVREQASRGCAQPFLDRAGALPLTTDLGLVTYAPSEAEWNAGLRYLGCLLYAAEDDGDVRSVMGWVEPQVTGIELEAGDCLNGSTRVSCDDEHTAEIVGIRDLDDPADAPYPDLGELFDELEALCEPSLETYEVAAGAVDVEAGVISDIAVGWEAGQRTYYCVAVAVDDDGITRTVIGSFEGEWELADPGFGT